MKTTGKLNGRGNIQSLYLQGKDTSRCSLSTVHPSPVQYRLHNMNPNYPYKQDSSYIMPSVYRSSQFWSNNLQRPHMPNSNRFGAHCAFPLLSLPYFAATGNFYEQKLKWVGLWCMLTLYLYLSVVQDSSSSWHPVL